MSWPATAILGDAPEIAADLGDGLPQAGGDLGLGPGAQPILILVGGAEIFLRQAQHHRLVLGRHAQDRHHHQQWIVDRDLADEVGLAAQLGQAIDVAARQGPHVGLQLADVLGRQPALRENAVFAVVRGVHPDHAAEALAGGRRGHGSGRQRPQAAEEHLVLAGHQLDVVEFRGHPERTIAGQFAPRERVVAADLPEDLVQRVHVGIGFRIDHRAGQMIGQAVGPDQVFNGHGVNPSMKSVGGRSAPRAAPCRGTGAPRRSRSRGRSRAWRPPRR